MNAARPAWDIQTITWWNNWGSMMPKKLIGDPKPCECGCGRMANVGRRFISGHNKSCLGKKFTNEHRYRMSLAQKGKKVSEEVKIRISEAMKGERNPFYGKKHSRESRLKISSKLKELYKDPKNHPCLGKPCSNETRRKIGLGNTGKIRSWKAKLRMSLAGVGRKVSQETRDKMSRTKSNPECKARMSAASKGRNNPMYGKPSPIGSSNGLGGWFNGFHFRSSCELAFLMANQDVEWKTAETLEFRIPYVDCDGKDRYYFADLFDGERLIEIKPKGWKRNPCQNKNVEEKRRAAESFCTENGWEYVFIEIPYIPRDKVFRFRSDGLIELDRKWEWKYQKQRSEKCLV